MLLVGPVPSPADKADLAQAGIERRREARLSRFARHAEKIGRHEAVVGFDAGRERDRTRADHRRDRLVAGHVGGVRPRSGDRGGRQRRNKNGKN